MFFFRIFTGVILMIWGADARYKPNDRCQVDGFPMGRCKIGDDCTTLQQYLVAGKAKLNDFHCGYETPFSPRMYCCPDDPPLPRATPTRQTYAKHLVSLRYLNPVTLDDYIYQCTGVIVSPSFVLATTKCLGKNIVSRPNKILLGSTDPSKYVDSQIATDIKRNISYNNELVLFELEKELTSSQLSGIVSVAPTCLTSDVKGDPKTFAVGFAFNLDESTNCALFSQQMRNVHIDQCRNVENKRQIQGLNFENSHLCFEPETVSSNSRQSEQCLRCLTASSSVLHVQRPDGSYCVAGIATPTTDECVENGAPVYYTNIVSDYRVSDFLINFVVDKSASTD
ncbi:uncharacterized protein LOC117784359 [Drosophila innubila]|uniref:uncharacterized protein LOC117784359 n=1 Tax=Drosophila innubila TaxID=198719 RepID=UPI00148B590D|nr:uncharacterized protein LOC117784359 [Drosophila innubila]